MAPQPSLHWLPALKSTQLKSLAASVGINSSSTKPALIAALQTHLPVGFFPQDAGAKRTKDARKQHDIISIDMGIRNLAYCRISLPPTWPPSSSNNAATSAAIPTISEWARIAIYPKPSSSVSRIKKNKHMKNDESASFTEDKPPLAGAAKEAFDPLTFSQHAYNLTSHLLTQYPTPPTQILIERQRFRSMGGSAVQEWTLRVNMFEAMLYAVLKTFSERGDWGGNAHAVAPGKVVRVWLGDGDGDGDGELEAGGNEAAVVEAGGRTGGKEVSKSVRTKMAKIRIVEGWLEEVLRKGGGEVEGRFKLEGNARVMGEAFLRKRNGERDVMVRQESIGGTKIEDAEIGKVDDLADCVLQGMAWVKWEENRRNILKGGMGALKKLL